MSGSYEYKAVLIDRHDGDTRLNALFNEGWVPIYQVAFYGNSSPNPILCTLKRRTVNLGNQTVLTEEEGPF